jgi:outer membrane protein
LADDSSTSSSDSSFNILSTMKKQFILFICMSLLSGMMLGQKIGYVDTERIMSKMGEYQAAQKEVDRFSQQWQSELEEMYAEIETMYRNYTAEEVLLPEDVKQERQQEIFQKEREAKEFRESKFGYDGALFKLQEAKMRPIQDKVLRGVKAIAKKKKYAMIYDIAGETTWLFTDPLYDLSDEVIEDMGLNEKKEGDKNN